VTDALPPRPLPEVAEYAAPYWAAAREHRLVLQHCPRCDRVQHFPRPWCTQCLHDELDFVDASGLGTVYSCTVVRRHPNPVFAARLPYVIALVDLDEGVRIHTNVVGCDPDTVHVGQRVRVCFEDVDDTHAVVLFTPDSSDPAGSPTAKDA
jgi:uncharacterized OB-fold protein